MTEAPYIELKCVCGGAVRLYITDNLPAAFVKFVQNHMKCLQHKGDCNCTGKPT